MTSVQLLLVAVAAVCVLAAIGAFAIAARRGAGGGRSWQDAVDREARAADRSEAMPPVLVEGPPAAAPEEVRPEPSPVEVLTERVGPAPVAVQPVEVEYEEVSPEEAGVTRRQFFNRALLATFGAFGAVLGIEMLAFMWPKLSGGFGSDINAGNLEALRTEVFQPDGSVLPLFIPDARAYIVPVTPAALAASQFAEKGVEAGELMALFQRCVHLGCRVPWCNTSQGFECPCHGSKYDAIGEYFAGPAPRNLDRFVVELTDDNDFIIKTGSIIETPRAPVLSMPYPQGVSCISIAPVQEEA